MPDGRAPRSDVGCCGLPHISALVLHDPERGERSDLGYVTPFARSTPCTSSAYLQTCDCVATPTTLPFFTGDTLISRKFDSAQIAACVRFSTLILRSKLWR